MRSTKHLIRGTKGMRKSVRKDFLYKKTVLRDLYRKLWESMVIFLSENEIKEGVWVDLYHRAYANERIVLIADIPQYLRMSTEYRLIATLYNAELRRRA